MNLKNVSIFVVMDNPIDNHPDYDLTEAAFTDLEDARSFIKSKKDVIKRWIAEVALTGKLPIIPVD